MDRWTTLNVSMYSFPNKNKDSIKKWVNPLFPLADPTSITLRSNQRSVSPHLGVCVRSCLHVFMPLWAYMCSYMSMRCLLYVQILNDCQEIWINWIHVEITQTSVDIYPNLIKPNLTWTNLTKPYLTKPSLTKPNLTKPNITKPNLTYPNLT